jgi:triacylglycerol lipase
MANNHPIVLVHGMFGWGPSELGGFSYWGAGMRVPCVMPRFLASTGPISSTHDRACELAFQIRGGRVDYGEQHAHAAGHQRYGRAHTGFHPGWSSEKPVHLIGHSLGGPTIWMLQHLLHIDYFGWGSRADWIRSITCVAGAMNGSTATYFLGCNEHTGLLDDRTLGSFLARAIELFASATGTLFDCIYDFDLDHWDCGARPQHEVLSAYLGRIVQSQMFRGKDNGAFSATLQGMREQNSLCQTHPGTYYFSHATQQTFAGVLSGYHRPHPRMNPFIIPIGLYIGSKIFTEPPYPGYVADDWWPNDGVVPSYSQLFPRTAGDHPSVEGISARASYDPGVWYHELLDGMDHIDIIAAPQFDQVGFQKRFYKQIYERLALL